MSVPAFSAIVVSYDVRDLLRRCLQTLQAQTHVTTEILVVDNASHDGSANMVAAEFPGVTLIRSAENLGFARANNLALAQARGAFLALVNPDTELPADVFSRIAGVFARHPRAGAVGPALCNLDGSPQPSCFAYPGVGNLILESTGATRFLLPLGLGTPSLAPTPRGGEGEVDWVSGACMVLTRAAYERTGGLEPSLFMYGEEMDWSWRARALGFASVFSAATRVIHHGGASSEAAVGALFVRNLQGRLAFLRAHRGGWRAVLARQVMAWGSLARLAAWELRAVAEGAAPSPRTRAQLERFRAVRDWYLRGAA